LLANSWPPLDGSSGSIWGTAGVEAKRKTMVITFDIIVRIFKVNPHLPFFVISKKYKGNRNDQKTHSDKVNNYNIQKA
jgi:hypothetical protein